MIYSSESEQYNHTYTSRVYMQNVQIFFDFFFFVAHKTKVRMELDSVITLHAIKREKWRKKVWNWSIFFHFFHLLIWPDPSEIHTRNYCQRDKASPEQTLKTRAFYQRRFFYFTAIACRFFWKNWVLLADSALSGELNIAISVWHVSTFLVYTVSTISRGRQRPEQRSYNKHRLNPFFPHNALLQSTKKRKLTRAIGWWIKTARIHKNQLRRSEFHNGPRNWQSKHVDATWFHITPEWREVGIISKSGVPNLGVTNHLEILH